MSALLQMYTRPACIDTQLCRATLIFHTQGVHHGFLYAPVRTASFVHINHVQEGCVSCRDMQDLLRCVLQPIQVVNLETLEE